MGSVANWLFTFLTSLTPSLFNEVSVPNQKRERSCICVCSVFFYDFSIGCWNCCNSVVFFVFTLLIYHWLNELGSWINLTTHTSLSPIRRGFAPGFVNYKKGALDSQPQMIKFTSFLPIAGGSLRVLRILPPLKLVAMI